MVTIIVRVTASVHRIGGLAKISVTHKFLHQFIGQVLIVTVELLHEAAALFEAKFGSTGARLGDTGIVWAVITVA